MVVKSCKNVQAANDSWLGRWHVQTLDWTGCLGLSSKSALCWANNGAAQIMHPTR